MASRLAWQNGKERGARGGHSLRQFGRSAIPLRATIFFSEDRASKDVMAEQSELADWPMRDPVMHWPKSPSFPRASPASFLCKPGSPPIPAFWRTQTYLASTRRL